jgi:hypothetical protein
VAGDAALLPDMRGLLKDLVTKASRLAEGTSNSMEDSVTGE